MTKPTELSYSAPFARFALRRPVTVVMVFFAMLILGLASSRLLPLEKFPGIDIPQLVVSAPYPNATPAEVERLIVRPLEEALATVSGIKEIRSFSRENDAVVVLMFDWEEEIGSRSIEIREQVESIRHTLPKDLERIYVMHFNTDDMPVLQIRISSDRDLSLAWDLLNKQLKEPLERADGVSKVDLYGVEQREIMIRLNPEAVIASGLTDNQILSMLRAANFTLSAGYMETERTRVRVVASDEFRNLEDIRTLPVTPHLTIADIAEVAYELPRKLDGRRFNQRYAIGLSVFKDSNANLVDVAHNVVSIIEAAATTPEFNDIQLMMMDNLAESVTDSLSDLLFAGLIGALLSITVLYLFLREWRLTLIIVLSVPAAICLTLGVMYLLGYSLNILSMMGLMLAVGMLIDNAVVVSESVRQEQELAIIDKRPLNEDIVELGAARVSLAIIAGTLTTAIVFLPNIFGAKEELTVFLEHVAIAICISLLASLLVAQTLIPLLLSKLKVKVNKRVRTEPRIKSAYLRSLRWSHRRPKLTSFFIFLLFASTALPMSQIKTDEADTAFNDRLYINYDIQGQYALDEVKQEVIQLENYLYANKDDFEIDNVYSYYSTDSATSTLLLKEKRHLSVPEIQDRIRKNMPLLPRSKVRFGFRGGDNDGVQITLSGRSTELLQELARDIMPILERIDGLVDVQTDNNKASEELQLHVNRIQAERYGLTTQSVANQVSTALRGTNLRSFRHNPEGDVRIRAAYPEAYELDFDLLQNVVVARDENALIRLDQVAQFDRQPRLSQISRYNRETAIRINANLDNLTLSEARVAIEAALEQIELPNGYSWSLDGGFRQQQEQNKNMAVNMLLAVCLVYMVMAALFESLLLPTAVIGSLVLAITGAFWGLWFTGSSMEMMAMIGMLILMGVVVNNGIVLVDQVNQLRDEGFNVEDAIIEGTSRRIRPILMTVATTILGLLPLALGSTQIGGDGPSYSPMAITIISGLLFSTITSLYFIPHAYSRLLYWRDHWGNVIRQSDPKGNKKAIV